MFPSSVETDTYRQKIINCLQHTYLISFRSLKREILYPLVVPPHKIFNVANVKGTVGYDCFCR